MPTSTHKKHVNQDGTQTNHLKSIMIAKMMSDCRNYIRKWDKTCTLHATRYRHKCLDHFSKIYEPNFNKVNTVLTELGLRYNSIDDSLLNKIQRTVEIRSKNFLKPENIDDNVFNVSRV